MNEREWLASEDPSAMLEWRQNMDQVNPPPRGRGWGMLSGRKLRLLAVACYRVWAPCPVPAIEEAVFRLAEEVAEGRAVCPADSNWVVLAEDAGVAALNSVRDIHPNGEPKPPGRDGQIAALLRDIVGDPFRPVAVKLGQGHTVRGKQGFGEVDGVEQDYQEYIYVSEWRTPTVLDLAHAAYEYCDSATGRLDPFRLALLADALEEAGCDDGAILNHLRGKCPACTDKSGFQWGKVAGCRSCNGSGCSPGTHVRGCHVVDTILGLE